MPRGLWCLNPAGLLAYPAQVLINLTFSLVVFPNGLDYATFTYCFQTETSSGDNPRNNEVLLQNMLKYGK